MADPPADTLAALLARPIDEKVFERNASADPRWLTDRRALFAADLPGDARLVARLARKGPAWNRSWGPERVAAVLRGAEGDACWPLAPLTLWRGPGMDILRWGLGPGRPVVDLSADYLRLALACLGGADAVTWNGEVPGGLVTLWRGGRAAAVLGPALAADDRDRVLPAVPPSALLAGEPDALEVAPPWAPPPVDLRDEEGTAERLARVARALGGAPDAHRGMAWALPTRAGVLRVGAGHGRSVRWLFDEPLRAARVAGPASGFNLSEPGSVEGVERLWSFILERELALAPELRGPVGAPPPLLGRRYRAEWQEVPGGFAERVRDGETGRFMRGAFLVKRYGASRPAERLAGRLNAARRLACAAAGAGAAP